MLEHKRPVCGWHRIEVRFPRHGDNSAHGCTVHWTAGMPVVQLMATPDAGKFELIFFARQPVSTVRLAFRTPALEGQEVRIAIVPVSRLGAIVRMMRRISERDRKKDIDPSRIYRKSWARWRRHGWRGFLSRLIREYQPHLVQWMQVEDPYQAWIEHVEKPQQEAALTASDLTGLGWKPWIDLVLCDAKTSDRELRATIESVLDQRYDKWTLWIDPDHLDSTARQTMARYAKDDHRIQLRPISTAESRTGSDERFVGAVAGGDLLPRHALIEIVRRLQAEPDARVIYTDHDEISENGARISPHFKPDWNPDLFLSQDYIGRLCLYRADLLRETDMLLGVGDDPVGVHTLFKCLPLLSNGQIVHVAQVLYHHRLNGAGRRQIDDQSGDLGLRARQDYFSAVGAQRTTVEPGLVRDTYRVRHPLPSPAPLVSLLIPTRDKLEVLEPCVRSILTKTTYPNYEVLILDNQSQSKDTLEFLAEIGRKDSRVRTIRYDRPFNFSAINNFGAAHAKGEILGLVNNDIEVITPDWLTEMVSHACRAEIGCVGAKLYYSNDTIQHGGVITGLWGVAGHAHKYFDRTDPGYFGRAVSTQNFSAVTAACLLVRKEIFDAVGGFDAEHLEVSFNDVDFCLRVREAGYRNLWTPFAELYHHESISRGPEDSPQKKAREQREIEYMKARWGHRLSSDPCYSPNLTQHMENFSINVDMILFPQSRTQDSVPG